MSTRCSPPVPITTPTVGHGMGTEHGSYNIEPKGDRCWLLSGDLLCGIGVDASVDFDDQALPGELVDDL
jgi:hypothetical protein